MPDALRSICLLLICVAAPLKGADVPVTLRTVSGSQQSGTLIGIDGSRLVFHVDEATHRIDLTGLIELHCHIVATEDADAGHLLCLNTGDRITVDIMRLQDDALLCRWRNFEDDLQFEIPLQEVLGLVLQADPDPRAQRSLERQFHQREFETDVLFLQNGDRLSGVFDGLDQSSCRFESAAGPFEVNRSRVAAVGFNAALLAPVEPLELRQVLHLTDGSWLTCRSVKWDGGSELRGVTSGGVQVPLPLRRLRSIACYGPRVTPLSELEPREVVMTPYLTRTRPPRLDRNAHDGPLQVRGESFAKGLGMYSRTRATWSLDGTYSSFQAFVGIDDAAGAGGHVTFAVELDGNRVFDSGAVTGGDDPLPVGPLDLQNAESISLVVDFGERGDIGDLANWCNPVLIR